MPKLNVGTVDLSEKTICWLKVAANTTGESMRVRAAKILNGHVKRFKNAYASEVAFQARQYQVTWEVMFNLLSKHEPPFTEEEIKDAKSEPPLVIWEEEKTYFGNELKEQPLGHQPTELDDHGSGQ